ncbi:MAG: single-stranded-DNA-specific exonuclease RecJ [Flavobacteriaceae bacterium]|nr:single-stranded-DNA-specific exonuclease RecJ [Flavobacteriaceae bacterium]
MRWTIKEKPNLNKIKDLAKQLNVDTALATLLVQRGIETFDEAKAFFRPDLLNLHNPFLMKDMDKAVNRIEQAIANNEKILIYGDYDVDGTTSVSLMYSYLKTLHTEIGTYIPDRYDEGYGVSFKGIDYAVAEKYTLIIALDCGIKAVDRVDYAKEKGVDFIICDHHRPADTIPNAVAVLDPKREDCDYPYKELCGCGVGFKLVQAIAEKKYQPVESLYPYLDLVAVAIAADIVPITGENRILTYYGLRVINTKPRIGLKALLHHIDKKELTVTDIVFTIAPRINAAGRIEHADKAIQLLTETDFDKALQFAKHIDDVNLERRSLDEQTTENALQQILDNKEENRFSTVVYDENWHKGVIGIVASRLIDTYYRPTLIFTKSGEHLAASARSVKGFDIYEALEKCSDLVEQFGGHKYAAGLTLLPENYEKFKQRFEEVVKSSIEDTSKTPEIVIDTEISLESITPKFFRVLKQFAPFGPQNMKPVFVSYGLRDNGYGKKVGKENKHLKLNVIEGTNSNTYNAIGFGLGEKFSMVKDGLPFKIAYSIYENHWNGYTSLQLQLKDLKEE